MKKIRAVIVEDEENLRKSLEELLELFCPKVQLVGMADNVKAGTSLIEKEMPQLIFLDIRLPDGSGFDLLNKLANKAEDQLNEKKVVFTTAYDEYALKAIKVDALDYLLKPIDPDELIQVVEKASHLIDQQHPMDNLNQLLHNLETKQLVDKKLAISTSNKVHLLDIDDIIRCESQDNYTTFHLKNEETILVSKTLKEFGNLLENHNFERVHRSHLINMNYLKSFVKNKGGYIVMKNNTIIPVAQRKKDYLLKKLRSLL